MKRQCVKHEIIKKDGKLYMLCRWCWEIKELTSDFWQRDKNSRTGFLYRCKECVKYKGRESCKRYYYSHLEYMESRRKKYYTNNREKIREKRRLNREKENAKRRERMAEISAKIHAHNKEMWYVNIQRRTRYLIDKLWIRPKECSICWYALSKIVAHHPDYNKPYEVVFCCNSCHRLIHLWELNVEDKYITNLNCNR